MSRPATRLLAMLEALQDRPGIGGRELAALLDVDERTVRRYATRLHEIGIPVEAARGRAGGYRLRAGYRLPPLMLTDEEAVAVVLGLVAAQQRGPEDAAARRALEKIDRVLPVTLRRRLAGLRGTVAILPDRRERQPPDTATLLLLGEAVQRHRSVGLGYVSWRGEATERGVDPYGLVLHDDRWYLSAHDHRSGELRIFRVDRISAATAGGPAATRAPPGFVAVGHVTCALAGGGWRHQVEVVLATTLEEALARIPPTVAALDSVPGGVRLRARAERLDGMAQLLAGLGWSFTIVEPPALRDAVAELADRLHDASRRP